MSKELIERLRKAGNYLREGTGSAIVANTIRQSIADAAFEAADALSLSGASQDAMAKALEEIADLASTEGSDPDYMLMLILGRAEAALAASRRSKEPSP